MQPKPVGHFFVVALCEAQSSHCDAIDAITSSDVFFCWVASNFPAFPNTIEQNVAFEWYDLPLMHCNVYQPFTGTENFQIDINLRGLKIDYENSKK